MKVAVLSDIHGNFWALQSVLNDIEKRKPDVMVNLGDSLYGPLLPLETYKLIEEVNLISVSGNQDRAILEHRLNSTVHPTMNYVVNALDDKCFAWLQKLPKTQLIENKLLAFHGTPESDKTYLLEALKDGNCQVNDEETIERYLNGVSASIILCGHSHTGRLVQTKDRMIINPGSVGLQAYDDELPIFHKMESFNNLAHYCMIEFGETEFNVEQISIQYDFEKAVQCALNNKRPDWAKWLKYGKA